jgi:hypothetical protein
MLLIDLGEDDYNDACMLLPIHDIRGRKMFSFSKHGRIRKEKRDKKILFPSFYLLDVRVFI